MSGDLTGSHLKRKNKNRAISCMFFPAIHPQTDKIICWNSGEQYDKAFLSHNFA
jgi:hypothetical protein